MKQLSESIHLQNISFMQYCIINKIMQDSSIKIGKKVFILSALIILALMIVSGLLTRILPAGLYDRIVSDGRTQIVNGTYHEIPRPDYPVWRWFTSPFEILAGMDNITPIVLMVFLLD